MRATSAYLRATKAYADRINGNDDQTSIASFTKAIELDPGYALAYVGRSIALADFGENYAASRDVRASLDSAAADARKAIALAPELGLGHLALAVAFEDALEFPRASEEYEHAYRLEPGNARIVGDYGFFAVYMGRADTGLAALRRGVTLDPVNFNSHLSLGIALMFSRGYSEALEVLRRAERLKPGDPIIAANIGITEYLLGNYQAAIEPCDKGEDIDIAQLCLAIAYNKLGRHRDAEVMLAKLRASRGDANAMLSAWALAQWGQTGRALDTLDTAARLRSPSLEGLKTAALLDPIRKEPRFQAIEKALKFPD